MKIKKKIKKKRELLRFGLFLARRTTARRFLDFLSIIIAQLWGFKWEGKRDTFSNLTHLKKDAIHSSREWLDEHRGWVGGWVWVCDSLLHISYR